MPRSWTARWPRSKTGSDASSAPETLARVALIVQKFGGTSVGGVDRIEGVADKVLAAREAGHALVVVVSAMAGETDRLLGLARAISTHGRPNPRELDVLLATGEQVTIALLC